MARNAETQPRVWQAGMSGNLDVELIFSSSFSCRLLLCAQEQSAARLWGVQPIIIPQLLFFAV